jgi:hypothetical protein
MIGSGMAVSAAVLTPAAFPLDGNISFTSRASLVLVDTRFDEAMDIARLTIAPRARIVTLPRDVLPLWHDELVPVLKQKMGALAGVTTEYTFFTMQTLAADQRLRARITATHAAMDRAHREKLVSWVIPAAASRG